MHTMHLYPLQENKVPYLKLTFVEVAVLKIRDKFYSLFSATPNVNNCTIKHPLKRALICFHVEFPRCRIIVSLISGLILTIFSSYIP